MRDIEFRAYIKDKNKIFNVKTIDFAYKFITFEEDNNPKDTMIMIDQVELMQYTGLKDKNGTKIFEGDVLIGDIPELVSSQNLIGIVEYEESAFIVKFPNRKSWQIQKVGFCSFINYRVISNIYDNPELIKE